MMKAIIFFFTLIFSFAVVNAQSTTRGAKTTQKFATINENSKENSAEEIVFASEETPVKKNIRRVTVASNIPGNYVVGKTTSPAYNPALKQATQANARVCQSKPINIRKTVSVSPEF